MANLNEYTRVLVVAAQQRSADELAHTLENSGCVVTSTTSVTTALDIAGYSDIDAVMVMEDIALPERDYLRSQMASYRPNTVVVSVRSARSAIIRLRQAFKEARSVDE